MVLRKGKYNTNKRVIKKPMKEEEWTYAYHLGLPKYDNSNYTNPKTLKTFKDEEGGEHFMQVQDDSHYEHIDKNERKRYYNKGKSEDNECVIDAEDVEMDLPQPTATFIKNKPKKIKKPKPNVVNPKLNVLHVDHKFDKTPETLHKIEVNKQIKEEEKKFDQSKMQQEEAKKVKKYIKVDGNLNHTTNAIVSNQDEQNQKYAKKHYHQVKGNTVLKYHDSQQYSNDYYYTHHNQSKKNRRIELQIKGDLGEYKEFSVV